MLGETCLQLSTFYQETALGLRVSQMSNPLVVKERGSPNQVMALRPLWMGTARFALEIVCEGRICTNAWTARRSYASVRSTLQMTSHIYLYIGMIIQEHVRELMNRPPPEGWEEMIANINMEDEDDWVPIPDDEGEWQVGSDQMSVISEGSVDQAVVGDNVIVLGEDSDSDSAASQDTPLQNLLPPEEHASIRHTRSKSQQKRPGSPEAGQEVDQPRVQASSKGRKTCDECKKKKGMHFFLLVNLEYLIICIMRVSLSEM